MVRLFVLVEGQTEESFVNNVLYHHLLSAGYVDVRARLMGNARQRANRGGVRGWQETQNDILRTLKEDTGCYVTTMVDYYGMPSTAGSSREWPGRSQSSALSGTLKAVHVQEQMHQRIIKAMGPSWDPSRFVPFVILHEFEALLFSDAPQSALSMGSPSLAAHLEAIAKSVPTPEHINDSPQTSPSHRILAIFPGYQKVLHGVAAVSDIGLGTIRNKCRHFSEWLTRLESIASPDNSRPQAGRL